MAGKSVAKFLVDNRLRKCILATGLLRLRRFFYALVTVLVAVVQVCWLVVPQDG